MVRRRAKEHAEDDEHRELEERSTRRARPIASRDRDQQSLAAECEPPVESTTAKSIGIKRTPVSTSQASSAPHGGGEALETRSAAGTLATAAPNAPEPKAVPKRMIARRAVRCVGAVGGGHFVRRGRRGAGVHQKESMVKNEGSRKRASARRRVPRSSATIQPSLAAALGRREP